MYQAIAILAAILLVYAAIAGRIERSSLSGPIVFAAVGFLLGPRLLDVLHLDLTAGGLRALAEFTLAMVLFTDAANADIAVVRRNLAIPRRLLLVGLPMTVILGMLMAGRYCLRWGCWKSLCSRPSWRRPMRLWVRPSSPIRRFPR